MIHNIYLKSGFCEISKNIFFTEQLWATATECGRNGKILNDDFLPNRVYFLGKEYLRQFIRPTKVCLMR